MFLELTLYQSVLSSDWISPSVLLSLPPATASHTPDIWTILNCLRFSGDIALSCALAVPSTQHVLPCWFAWQTLPLRLRLSSSYFISDSLLPLPGHVRRLDLKPLWR